MCGMSQKLPELVGGVEICKLGIIEQKQTNPGNFANNKLRDLMF